MIKERKPIPLDGFTCEKDYYASEEFKINCKKRFWCNKRGHKICNKPWIYLKCSLCMDCVCPHYKHPLNVKLVIK